MADLVGRYPFSTADGQAIPLDIIRPEGMVSLAIQNNSPSAAFSLSASIDCFSLRSTVDCYIKFATSGAVAAVPTHGVYAADVLYLPRDTITIMSPPIDKRSISVISDKGNGHLFVQYLQTWSGLALKNQQIRR